MFPKVEVSNLSLSIKLSDGTASNYKTASIVLCGICCLDFVFKYVIYSLGNQNLDVLREYCNTIIAFLHFFHHDHST